MSRRVHRAAPLHVLFARLVAKKRKDHVVPPVEDREGPSFRVFCERVGRIVKIAAWRTEYNENRPHSSLGYKTPKEFAEAQAAGFYTAERGARDSNAVPCPSRSPIPAQTQDGVA